jgi:hypothetical protein|tara:strand:+ start:5534 stop:5674 length:141 start_codon:yes stop_codon:yes gene_type:complete
MTKKKTGKKKKKDTPTLYWDGKVNPAIFNVFNRLQNRLKRKCNDKY